MSDSRRPQRRYRVDRALEPLLYVKNRRAVLGQSARVVPLRYLAPDERRKLLDLVTTSL